MENLLGSVGFRYGCNELGMFRDELSRSGCERKNLEWIFCQGDQEDGRPFSGRYHKGLED